MRMALTSLVAVLLLAGGSELREGRQQWLVKVNETAPSNCDDTFAGFREALNITKRLDLGGRIKSTVINHLLRSMLSIDWSGQDDQTQDSHTINHYTADLLGPATWLKAPTNESGGDGGGEGGGGGDDDDKSSDGEGSTTDSESTTDSAGSADSADSADSAGSADSDDSADTTTTTTTGSGVGAVALDGSTRDSQLYEHDKLMGRQTLSRLKEAIQAYFDSTGLISTIWHGAMGEEVEEVNEELLRSNEAANAFFQSSYSENLLDQVIGQASLNIFPNISLTVDSAMINLGDALCKTTELTQQGDEEIDQTQLDHFTCATHSLLEMGLTCNARDLHPPDCTSPATDQALICDIPQIGIQDPFSDTFKIYPDIQPIPDHQSQIPIQQGNLDRWLLRAVSELYRYTKYDVVCKKDQESTLKVLLPGWQLITDIWLDYSDIVNLNQTQKEAPFSVLLKKPDSCDFVVVNRGSVFKSDWLIDFDYDLVELFYRPEDFIIDPTNFATTPSSTTSSSSSGTTSGGGEGVPSMRTEALGKLSRGYEGIAVETAKIIFYEILRTTNCTEVDSIIFTGHSMGGIIGAAQALLMSSLYSASHQPKLSLVSFAAPSAIDARFKELIDHRATVRGWVIELDAVSKIPCKNALPNCHQLKNSVPTDLIERPSHEQLPHTITIPNSLVAKLMPSLGESSFGTVSYNVFTGNLNLDSITFPGTTLFAQTHTCAYTCWMNAAYCSMTSAQEVCTACIGQ